MFVSNDAALVIFDLPIIRDRRSVPYDEFLDELAIKLRSVPEGTKACRRWREPPDTCPKTNPSPSGATEIRLKSRKGRKHVAGGVSHRIRVRN